MDLTVGQWMEEAILEKVERERQEGSDGNSN